MKNLGLFLALLGLTFIILDHNGSGTVLLAAAFCWYHFQKRNHSTNIVLWTLGPTLVIIGTIFALLGGTIGTLASSFLAVRVFHLAKTPQSSTH